jgi:activator of HSP90 ATPase
MKPKVTTINQKVVIKASLDEVYEAFIDPEKHSSFTGSKATGTPKVNGKFTAWDGYIFGTNLELEKGKKIVQDWKTTEWPPNYPPSTLKLTFKKTEEGTEITMVHSNVPAEQAEDLRQGWIDFYWEPLKKYFKK